MAIKLPSEQCPCRSFRYSPLLLLRQTGLTIMRSANVTRGTADCSKDCVWWRFQLEVFPSRKWSAPSKYCRANLRELLRLSSRLELTTVNNRPTKLKKRIFGNCFFFVWPSICPCLHPFSLPSVQQQKFLRGLPLPSCVFAQLKNPALLLLLAFIGQIA